METHSHKKRNQSDATATAGETLVGQAGHILVIDDDLGTRETLSDVLRLRDYTIETAGNGQEGLKKLSTRRFDAAIVDIKLPDISGSDLLRLIKKASPKIEVILITAFASLNSAIEAVSGDAFAYITKPFEMDHLLATLNKALEKRRLALGFRRLYQVTLQELAERKLAEEERARLLVAMKRNLEHKPALQAATATASQSLELNTEVQKVIKKITEILCIPLDKPREQTPAKGN